MSFGDDEEEDDIIDFDEWEEDGTREEDAMKKQKEQQERQARAKQRERQQEEQRRREQQRRAADEKKKKKEREKATTRDEGSKKKTKSKSRSTASLSSWGSKQRAVREAIITPLLPPPVVRYIENELDPSLRPYFGPEATMTLLGTVLVAYLVALSLRFVMKNVAGAGGGRAYRDDGDDAIMRRGRGGEGGSREEPARVDGTVLLCGAPDAGKTRLFYNLCYGRPNAPTVMSIKANVAVSTPLLRERSSRAAAAAARAAAIAASKRGKKKGKKEGGGGGGGTKQKDGGENDHSSSSHQDGDRGDDNGDGGDGAELSGPVIRYMDWPGYASIHDGILLPVLRNTPDLRIVFVVDSTQPVTSAADVLFQLLQHCYYQCHVNPVTRGRKTTVFVACHKKDASKSKNWRRVKIQLRTELQRLIKLRSAEAAAAKAADEAAGGGGDAAGRNATPSPEHHDGDDDQKQIDNLIWWRLQQQSSSSSSSPGGTGNKKSSSSPSSSAANGDAGAVELDLDQFDFVKLHFTSTTCIVKPKSIVTGNEELNKFCYTGEIPKPAS